MHTREIKLIKPESGSKFDTTPEEPRSSPQGRDSLRTHTSLRRESAGALAAEDDERHMRALFNNASRIPHGHAQMSMAMNMGRSDPKAMAQQTQEQRKERERYATLEMQRLAEWNAKMVTIAGVQMTNEQAQNARRRFIENEDEYAERAVQRGLIRDGEQGQLKQAMRRRESLEDRVGRGNASPDERLELEALKNSRMGRKADEITAHIHKNEFGNTHKASFVKEPAASGTDMTLPPARDLFQSVPVAQKAFAKAAQPIEEYNATTSEALPESPSPVTRSVRATGLEI